MNDGAWVSNWSTALAYARRDSVKWQCRTRVYGFWSERRQAWRYTWGVAV